MFIPLRLMAVYLENLKPGRTPAQCHVKHHRDLDDLDSFESLCRHRDANKPKCRHRHAQLTQPRRVYSALEMV